MNATSTDPERDAVNDAGSAEAELGRAASSPPAGWFDFWIRRGWRVWMLAVVVFVADQLSKAYVSNWLRWGDSWPEEGWLRLTHARNTGAAFSILEGQSTLLSIVSLVAIGLILWLYRASGNTSLMLRIALSLQLGGAFGNLIDRVRQGYVVDFFDVGPWPIFNVADSSITVGIALLLVYVFFGQRSPEHVADGASPGSLPGPDVAAPSSPSYCETCYRRRAYVQRLEMQSHAAGSAAAETDAREVNVASEAACAVATVAVGVGTGASVDTAPPDATSPEVAQSIGLATPTSPNVARAAGPASPDA